MFFIMQKLKPEIEKAILNAAERHFLSEGFQPATMRGIADTAGIRVSNLYLYFKNKEELFNRLISPFHARFESGINEFLSHSDENASMPERMKVLINILTSFITHNSSLFIILIDKSGGTKFSKYRTKLAGYITGHIEHEIKRPFDNALLSIITENLLNCFVHIAGRNMSEENIQSALGMVLQYHTGGISSFMR